VLLTCAVTSAPTPAMDTSVVVLEQGDSPATIKLVQVPSLKIIKFKL